MTLLSHTLACQRTARNDKSPLQSQNSTKAMTTQSCIDIALFSPPRQRVNKNCSQFHGIFAHSIWLPSDLIKLSVYYSMCSTFVC